MESPSSPKAKRKPECKCVPKSPFKMPPYKCVFMRVGQSQYYQEKQLSGWYDTLLTDEGIEETKRSVLFIKDARLQIDVIFTSLLSRARKTAEIMKEEMATFGKKGIVIRTHWMLNDKHEGALTGYSVPQIMTMYGVEQVNEWRWNREVLPPPIDESHPLHEEILNNPLFKDANGPKPDEFPNGESVQNVADRVIPYWERVIKKMIKRDVNVMVVGHGKVIKALVKHIEKIPDKDMIKVNIPRTLPFIYEFNTEMEPILCRKYLADDETVEMIRERMVSTEEITQYNWWIEQKREAEEQEQAESVNLNERWTMVDGCVQGMKP